MPVDLVIKNGTVCSVGGRFRASVAVDDEKIVAIGKEANLPQADETIDASGLLIMPGIIDVHTHIRDLDVAYKEDYEHASKAAAAGGITMHVDMPNTKPPTTTVQRFIEKRKYADGHTIVDFNMYPSASSLSEIPKLKDLGILGYKIFMLSDTKRDFPHMPEIGVSNLGHLMEIFKAVKKTGLPITVHPHEQELQNYIDEEVRKELGTGPMAYYEAGLRYDTLSVRVAVSNCIILAEATGVRLHLTHMANARMIEMVRLAKMNGAADLTCDSHPPWVFITKSIVEKLGPLALGRGKTPEGQEAIWNGWNDDTIDIISSEHAPHAQDEKKIGWEDMWKAAGGAGSQLQEMLPLFLTQINKGRMSLERFIACTSLNPSKIFGVYPKKGAIEVGSDADLTIVDMKKKDILSNEKCYSKCGYSCYDGMEVQGVPIYTICRGTVVMHDGEITVKPGYGKFQPRINHMKN